MSLLKFLRKVYLKASLSQSTADPFTSLIAEPWREREVVFRGEPLDSNGAVVNFDISGGGYKSQSTDTPHALFRPAIRGAYNFSVSLPLPDLFGSTSVGVDATIFNNAQGDLDPYLRLDWLGRTSDIYLGAPEPTPFSEFTRIFKGTSAGLTWSMDTVMLLGRDVRFKLRRKLTANRYTGMGAQVRYNGTTSFATGSVTAPVNAMVLEFIVTLQTNVTSQKVVGGWRNGTSAGQRMVAIGSAGTNLPTFFVRNDAGTQFSITGSSLTLGERTHLAFVLDPFVSQKVYCYKNGVLDGSTSGLSGTWATALTTFALARLADSASQFIDAEIDEVRIWSGARTQTQIYDNKDHELLGSESGLSHYYKCNEGSSTTLADSVTVSPVNLTLTDPIWVGSLEGDSSLTGTVKPIALGVCKQVEPKWVDPQRLVVQYHDGSMQGITAQRDNGDLLTFGADLSDIYSATPSAGTYNTCKAKGLVRFGSTPVGAITGDIQGANGGIIGYATTGAEINRKLYVDYGGLNNSTEIDDSAYDALSVLNPNAIGLYYDIDTSIDQAGNDALRSILAWGSPTRTGVMTVGRIDDPRNLTPSVSWTNSNIGANSNDYYREPLGIRYKEIVIGYQPYYKVLSPNEVAGTIPLSTRDDFAKQYRYVSQKIEGAGEDASVLEILTSLDSREAALEELNRLIPFLGSDLEKVTLRLTLGLFNYFIGTVASLLITQVDHRGDTIDRFGGLMNYICVGVSETLGQHGQPDSLQVTLIGVSENG